MAPARAEREYPAEPGSVRLARDLARSTLGDLEAGELGDILVAVSELTTNCVRHARSPFTLRILRGDGQVRVEVDDRSSDLPVRRSPDLRASGGRGLLLLDVLADAWGIEPRRDGKRVWASFAIG
jgi:anti-sigma regulatory factor (Ser/Thr protein kinase)